MIYRFNL